MADLRIHGTTKRQVAQLFAEEKQYLLTLPASVFPVFQSRHGDRDRSVRAPNGASDRHRVGAADAGQFIGRVRGERFTDAPTPPPKSVGGVGASVAFSAAHARRSWL